MAGAKRGNRNAAKGTAVRDSLWKSLKQWQDSDGERGNALRKITDTLVQEAMNPESSNYQFAVKEIGLRIDGSPKSDSGGGSSPQVYIGISEAFAGLIAAQSGAETIDGTALVSDGSVLPSPLRAETGGHGEAVDIREMSGGSEGTERSD